MKRIRRVLVVIAFLFAAALVYGLIIQPIKNILPGASRPQATPEPVITGTPSPGPTAAPSAAPTVAPTQAPTEPITPAPTDPPTLRQGDKSDAVRQLATRLLRIFALCIWSQNNPRRQNNRSRPTGFSCA